MRKTERTGKAPAMQMYMNDLLRELNKLGCGARGLWVTMLCYMWDSPVRGALVHADGSPWTDEDVIRISGERGSVAAKYLQELERKAIFSRLRVTPEMRQSAISGAHLRSGSQIIVNRRMYRESAISNKRREAARSKWGGQSAQGVRTERMRAAKALGTHSKEEWESLLSACGYKCVRCGYANGTIVKDHVVPVYQGGSDAIDNLQPLCIRCNSQKGPDSTDHAAKYREFCSSKNACKMPAKARPSARKSSSSSSSTTTTTTETAAAQDAERFNATTTTTNPDGLGSRQPPGNPNPELAAQLRPELAELLGALGESAELPGAPPASVVSVCADLLAERYGSVAEVEAVYPDLLDARIKLGAPRQWRWFATVTKNAIVEGDL